MLRPLLASLLCGMIAFGHAPAWLHVADCGGEVHVGQVHRHADDEHDVCQHHRHDHASGDATQAGGHDESSHHDSDSCVICQSLAAPTGFTFELTAPPTIGLVAEPLAILDAARPADALLSIPQPRGPPAIAA